ncbi:keywimysin-related RiPP [Sinosporangium siamense]|nr:keywimysin-related RiPP [Sinosporangium siamense]
MKKRAVYERPRLHEVGSFRKRTNGIGHWNRDGVIGRWI